MFESSCCTCVQLRTDSKRAEALKLRVIEHNTMVAAKFYSDIRMHRLSQLLDLSMDDVSC
jgi:26S proteasome regulatory subunit N5